MSAQDDHMKQLIYRAAGSPTVVARDELLESLTGRIEAGGVDVAHAPLPHQGLSAVPGGKPVTLRRLHKSARISSIGFAGMVALTVGTAAAASVGAWIALSPQAPPAPVMVTTAPTVDTSPVPPVDSPDIDIASQESVEVVVPPLIEPADGLEDLKPLEGVLPGDGPADLLAPVISAISVGELSGSLVDILNCTALAPISVSATDDTEVSSVVARVTAVGGIDLTIPLAKTGHDTWTGSIAGLHLVQVVPLGSVATVTVEATDAAGNTSTSPVTVPLTSLLCG